MRPLAEIEADIAFHRTAIFELTDEKNKPVSFISSLEFEANNIEVE